MLSLLIIHATISIAETRILGLAPVEEHNLPIPSDDSTVLSKRDGSSTPDLSTFVKTVTDDDVSITLNISLVTGGCNRVQEDAVIGAYTYTNGTLNTDATLGEIQDDLEALERSALSRRLAVRALSNHTRALAKQLFVASKNLERSLLCEQETQDTSSIVVENVDRDVSLHDELRRRLLWNADAVQKKVKNAFIQFGIISFSAAAAGAAAGLFIRYTDINGANYKAKSADLESVESVLSSIQAESSSVPSEYQDTYISLLGETDDLYTAWSYAYWSGAFTAIVSTIASTILVSSLTSCFIDSREATAVNVEIARLGREVRAAQRRLDELRAEGPVDSSVLITTTSSLEPTPSAMIRQSANSTQSTSTTKFSVPAPTGESCLSRQEFGRLVRNVADKGSLILGDKEEPRVEPDIEMGLRGVDALIALCVAGSG